MLLSTLSLHDDPDSDLEWLEGHINALHDEPHVPQIYGQQYLNKTLTGLFDDIRDEIHEEESELRQSFEDSSPDDSTRNFDPDSRSQRRKEEARKALLRVPQKYKDLHWNGRSDGYETVLQEWDGAHLNRVLTRLAPAVQAEVNRWKELRSKSNLETINKLKTNPGTPFRICDDVLKTLTEKVKKKLGAIDDHTTIHDIVSALKELDITPPALVFRQNYVVEILQYGQWRTKVAKDRIIAVHGKDKGHDGIFRCARGMQRCQQEWYTINFSNPDSQGCLWADPARIYWVTLTTDRDMDNTNYLKRVRQVLDYLNKRIYKGSYKGITGIAVVEWKDGIRHVHLKLIIPPDATDELPITKDHIKTWNDILFEKWSKIVAKEKTRFCGAIRAVKLGQDGQILKGREDDIYRTIDYQCKTELEDAERKTVKRTKDLLQLAAIACSKYKNESKVLEDAFEHRFDIYALLDSLDPLILISDEEMAALSSWLPFATDADRAHANAYFEAVGRTDMVNTKTMADFKPSRPAYAKQWFKYNPNQFEKYRHCKEEIVDHDVGRHVKAECCKKTNQKLSKTKSKIRVSPRPFQVDMTFCFLTQQEFRECVNRARTAKKKANMLIALGKADLVMRKFGALAADLHHILAKSQIEDITNPNPLPLASGWS